MRHPPYTYFDWLKWQIESFTEAGSHDLLFHRLHQKGYYALLPDDENRMCDGVELRNEYGNRADGEELVFDTSSSVFEVMISLAKKMNYIYSPVREDHLVDCFNMMLTNSGLAAFTNEQYFELGGDIEVDRIVDRILNREYPKDGKGNFFYTKWDTDEDQRNISLWYQLNKYIYQIMKKEGRV